MTSQRMIKAYFQQGEQYFSEHGERLISIKNMNPVHAANAAKRLLDDSAVWAREVNARGSMHTASLWMTTTPLFQALVARAGEGV